LKDVERVSALGVEGELLQSGRNGLLGRYLGDQVIRGKKRSSKGLEKVRKFKRIKRTGNKKGRGTVRGNRKVLSSRGITSESTCKVGNQERKTGLILK